MKYIQLTFSLLMFAFTALSQHGPAPKPATLVGQSAYVMSDFHNSLLNNNNLNNTIRGISGSPFLYDYWGQGTAKLINGAIYKDLKLKYDQFNDRPLFCEDEGNPQAFADMVAEFTIPVIINDSVVSERKFRNGFLCGDSDTKIFYEVLVDGKTTLLKKVSKAIVEENPVGSNLKSKQIKEISVKYYLLISSKLTKIKKDQKSILSALNDKSSELEKHSKENKLNFKEEDDLVKIINYYNTL